MTESRRQALVLLLVIAIALPVELVLLNINWAPGGGMDWFGWLR